MSSLQPNIWPEGEAAPEYAPDETWYAVVYVDGSTATSPPHLTDLQATTEEVETAHVPQDGAPHQVVVEWRRRGTAGTLKRVRWTAAARRRPVAAGPAPMGAGDVAAEALRLAADTRDADRRWATEQMERERQERRDSWQQVREAHTAAVLAHTEALREVAAGQRAVLESRASDIERQRLELEQARLELERQRYALAAQPAPPAAAQPGGESGWVTAAKVATAVGPAVIAAGGALLDRFGGLEGVAERIKSAVVGGVGAEAKADLVRTLFEGIQGTLAVYRGLGHEAPTDTTRTEDADTVDTDDRSVVA